jgi:hypothetical protein
MTDEVTRAFASPAGHMRGMTAAEPSQEDRSMPQEISWGRDFDAALRTAGDKLVLLDFSAAPM